MAAWIKLHIALALGLLVAGCSTGGSIPGIDRQDKEIGIFKTHVLFHEDGTLEEVVITDGKDHVNVKAEYIKPDGTVVRYSSDKSDASTGAAVRGEVDKVQASEGSEVLKGATEILPEVIDKVVP